MYIYNYIYISHLADTFIQSDFKDEIIIIIC